MPTRTPKWDFFKHLTDPELTLFGYRIDIDGNLLAITGKSVEDSKPRIKLLSVNLGIKPIVMENGDQIIEEEVEDISCQFKLSEFAPHGSNNCENMADYEIGQQCNIVCGDDFVSFFNFLQH